MTKNITLSISDRLEKQMNEMPEVNWSAVARGCISQYIENRRNPDISSLLEELHRQKSEEYVKGRRDAETLVDELGYSRFNILMNKYYAETEEEEFTVGAPDEFGHVRTPDSIMEELLNKEKVLSQEVSDAYLKGMRERLIEVYRALSKGSQ